MSKAKDYKRILIVRTDKIGDLVLSTPVIKAVRDFYPHSYIAAVVRPYAHEIIKDNPYLNEVITYEKAKKGSSILTDLKFIIKLRKKKFDLALVLHPKNRTHIIMFLAGIRERIGYNKKLGVLLTKKIPHLKEYGIKHEIDYTLDIVRYAGIIPKEKNLHISIDKSAEQRVDSIFEKNGIAKDDLIITLHPGASCRSKKWSVERFAKAADSLAQKYKAKIIIVAGSVDKMLGDKMSTLMKSKNVNLSGKTTVSDIVSILKRSNLFISNDSGPVHIACAIKTPVISIFGRNDRGLSPERWKPVGKHDIALHKNVGCKLCLAHNCKRGFACLDAITVEDVLQAADRILVK